MKFRSIIMDTRHTLSSTACGVININLFVSRWVKSSSDRQLIRVNNCGSRSTTVWSKTSCVIISQSHRISQLLQFIIFKNVLLSSSVLHPYRLVILWERFFKIRLWFTIGTRSLIGYVSWVLSLLINNFFSVTILRLCNMLFGNLFIF